MDPQNAEKKLDEPRYLSFPHLSQDATHDGKPALNRFSSVMTRDHDYPGAQVCGIPTVEDVCRFTLARALLRLVMNELLTLSGHVVRGGCTRSRKHEEEPTSWCRLGVVGGKSLQVSFNTVIEVRRHGYADNDTLLACIVSRLQDSTPATSSFLSAAIGPPADMEG